MAKRAYTPDVGDKKKRTCLKCQKEFMSSSAANRICSNCNKSPDRIKVISDRYRPTKLRDE